MELKMAIELGKNIFSIVKNVYEVYKKIKMEVEIENEIQEKINEMISIRYDNNEYYAIDNINEGTFLEEIIEENYHRTCRMTHNDYIEISEKCNFIIKESGIVFYFLDELCSFCTKVLEKKIANANQNMQIILRRFDELNNKGNLTITEEKELRNIIQTKLDIGEYEDCLDIKNKYLSKMNISKETRNCIDADIDFFVDVDKFKSLSIDINDSSIKKKRYILSLGNINEFDLLNKNNEVIYLKDNISLTMDNDYKIKVNGEELLEGENEHFYKRMIIKMLLEEDGKSLAIAKKMFEKKIKDKDFLFDCLENACSLYFVDSIKDKKKYEQLVINIDKINCLDLIYKKYILKSIYTFETMNHISSGIILKIKDSPNDWEKEMYYKYKMLEENAIPFEVLFSFCEKIKKYDLIAQYLLNCLKSGEGIENIKRDYPDLWKKDFMIFQVELDSLSNNIEKRNFLISAKDIYGEKYSYRCYEVICEFKCGKEYHGLFEKLEEDIVNTQYFCEIVDYLKCIEIIHYEDALDRFCSCLTEPDDCLLLIIAEIYYNFGLEKNSKKISDIYNRVNSVLFKSDDYVRFYNVEIAMNNEGKAFEIITDAYDRFKQEWFLFKIMEYKVKINDFKEDKYFFDAVQRTDKAFLNLVSYIYKANHDFEKSDEFTIKTYLKSFDNEVLGYIEDTSIKTGNINDSGERNSISSGCCATLVNENKTVVICIYEEKYANFIGENRNGNEFHYSFDSEEVSNMLFKLKGENVYFNGELFKIESIVNLKSYFGMKFLKHTVLTGKGVAVKITDGENPRDAITNVINRLKDDRDVFFRSKDFFEMRNGFSFGMVMKKMEKTVGKHFLSHVVIYIFQIQWYVDKMYKTMKKLFLISILSILKREFLLEMIVPF